MWNPTRRLRSHSTCRVTMPHRAGADPRDHALAFRPFRGTGARAGSRTREPVREPHFDSGQAGCGAAVRNVRSSGGNPARSDGSSDRRVPAGHRHPAVVGSGPLAVPLRHARLFELPRTRKPDPSPWCSCWRRGSCFPRKGCWWSVPPRTLTTAPLGCFRLRGRNTGPLPSVSGEYACRGRHAGAAVPAL